MTADSVDSTPPTTSAPPTTSVDGFLGKALTITQPKDGHRSGTDAVLLAASIEANNGLTCLELGSGAGVASLCLAHRLGAHRLDAPQLDAKILDLHVLGVEIDANLVAMAQQNAVTNGLAARVKFAAQDIHDNFENWVLPQAKRAGFEQVFANPPFYLDGTSMPPPNANKQQAHIARPDTLDVWVRRAATLLKARGHLTMIHRAQDLPFLLDAMRGRFGGIEVKPIQPHPDQTANRILVRGQRDSQAPLRLLAPLILHTANGDYTEAVTDILRNGSSLNWGS